MERAVVDGRARELVEKRLIQNPPELLKLFPSILSAEDVTSFTYLSEKYFILALIRRKDKERLKRLVTKGLPPFPYLIREDKGSAGFRIENSRNVFIDTVDVKEGFAMSLGKDSTIVLCNFSKVNKTPAGLQGYTIELAYVISFGDEIKQYNLLDFLEDLIAYSIKQWKQEYGKPV